MCGAKPLKFARHSKFRFCKAQYHPIAGLRVPSPETRFKLIPESLGRRRPVCSQSQGKVPVSQLWLLWILTFLYDRAERSVVVK
jgi:hypothetical protein